MSEGDGDDVGLDTDSTIVVGQLDPVGLVGDPPVGPIHAVVAADSLLRSLCGFMPGVVWDIAWPGEDPDAPLCPTCALLSQVEPPGNN